MDDLGVSHYFWKHPYPSDLKSSVRLQVTFLQGWRALVFFWGWFGFSFRCGSHDATGFSKMNLPKNPLPFWGNSVGFSWDAGFPPCFPELGSFPTFLEDLGIILQPTDLHYGIPSGSLSGWAMAKKETWDIGLSAILGALSGVRSGKGSKEPDNGRTGISHVVTLWEGCLCRRAKDETLLIFF